QEKGAYDLIDAMARITRSHPSVQLLLGGDGDLQEAAERAKQLGVQDSVKLLGWVTGERKANLLSSASVFCLPSYNEGLPMSLLEAMASGLPVVTTPVGGIPEAVTDGREGYLVEPGDVGSLADKLRALIDNRILAREMGQEARKKALEKYSVERVM